MFPLISSVTQQPTSSIILESSPPINPPPIKKNPMSYFNKSFISSGKQGGGATVLGDRSDIVRRETCVPTSLNINNLGKAAVLHFALFCGWGHTKLSLPIIGHSFAYVKFS
jgi:hypothetical protein